MGEEYQRFNILYKNNEDLTTLLDQLQKLKFKFLNDENDLSNRFNDLVTHLKNSIDELFVELNQYGDYNTHDEDSQYVMLVSNVQYCYAKIRELQLKYEDEKQNIVYKKNSVLEQIKQVETMINNETFIIAVNQFNNLTI